MHVKTEQCAVPNNNAKENAAILLNSHCSSQFEQTARFQWKHIGTGRCTSPHLGHQWPIIGTRIVLSDECDVASSSRTQFMFMYGKKSKDRDTTFYSRGPWANRVRIKASQNLEGGLRDADLFSSIQIGVTGNLR